MRKRRRKMKITMKRNNVLMGTAALLVFTMLAVPDVYAEDCVVTGQVVLQANQYHLVLVDKMPKCIVVTAGTQGTFKIKIVPAGPPYNIDYG
jgi:hypothetical protein